MSQKLERMYVRVVAKAEKMCQKLGMCAKRWDGTWKNVKSWEKREKNQNSFKNKRKCAKSR